MATANLFQIVKTRKLKMGPPEILSGVTQLLLKICPDTTLSQMGLNPDKTVLAIGQHMRHAPSEVAFVVQPEIDGGQRAYNRFLHQAPATTLLRVLICELPKEFFSGPGSIGSLDDTPVKKSGKVMSLIGKFFHNNEFYPTLTEYHLAALVQGASVLADKKIFGSRLNYWLSNLKKTNLLYVILRRDT